MRPLCRACDITVTYVPEHISAQTVGVHVLCLEASDVRGIIGNELHLASVIRVASDVSEILKYLVGTV